MRRSSVPARLLTIVIALVITPIALVLLSMGGMTMNRSFFEFGFDGDIGRLVGPLLLQSLAVVLLALVVLSGIWSSAGLIVVGVFALLPLIVAIVPGTLPLVFRAVPQECGDGLVYGIPLAVLTALGAMGLALFLVRRDPRPRGAALSVIGIVAAPVLLGAGAWALAWGTAEGMLFALQRFQFDPRPDAVAAVLAGILLVFAGVLVSRWSPFALILPALVLLVGSLLMLVAPEWASRVLFALPRGVNTVIPSQLLYGAAAAAGILYIAFTAVLLRVRSQARLSGTEDPHAPGAAAPYPYPPAQHPGAEATYPPAPYPGAQAPYPPAQYPPAPHPPQPGP